MFQRFAAVSDIKHLFDPSSGRNDTNTRIVEDLLARNVHALTRSQRTAEWFLLRQFHLTATMAGRILNLANEIEDDRMIPMLLSSWFSRQQSTEEM